MHSVFRLSLLYSHIYTGSIVQAYKFVCCSTFWYSFWHLNRSTVYIYISFSLSFSQYLKSFEKFFFYTIGAFRYGLWSRFVIFKDPFCSQAYELYSDHWPSFFNQRPCICYTYKLKFCIFWILFVLVSFEQKTHFIFMCIFHKIVCILLLLIHFVLIPHPQIEDPIFSWRWS